MKRNIYLFFFFFSLLLCSTLYPTPIAHTVCNWKIVVNQDRLISDYRFPCSNPWYSMPQQTTNQPQTLPITPSHQLLQFLPAHKLAWVFSATLHFPICKDEELKALSPLHIKYSNWNYIQGKMISAKTNYRFYYSFVYFISYIDFLFLLFKYIYSYKCTYLYFHIAHL